MNPVIHRRGENFMAARRRGASGRNAKWLCWGLALGLLSGLRADRAEGQAEIRNVTQPIPVLNTGGHSAPVRGLIFAPPDGGQLLSAGLDKIVNTWNLREAHPAVARTIRPRIWRGYAGAIYAMALSPVAEPDGQRLLAVAGIGVSNSRGEIGLFRFPGSNNQPTGDVLPPLPGGNPDGHAMSVMSLAFHPKGGFLASASNDTTVRVWNLQTRRNPAVLNGHTKPVNAVAYLPDGNHLVSGGADGQILLWDVNQRTIVARARPNPQRQRANDPDGDAVNALAVSPDGRYLVIGRENGDLIRYDAANLQNERLLPKAGNGQGAVETLAISPDGKWLATSLLSFALTNAADRPRADCDVELRTMPGGEIQARLATASNLVLACTFSPDSRRLAYAGGDAQGITIRDLVDLNAPAVELAGQGSSLWDVGFSGDSSAIGYARRRPDRADPLSKYEDFDLQGKRLAPFAPAELSRAQTTWNGWTFRPVDQYTIDVLPAKGPGHRLTLDRRFDRRWWSYSFIPPTPAHPRPLAAIACEAGVVLYRLDDGLRTRLLAGHNGPVYALAPSPDGKWLATGSSDQTVRLWRLAGMDALAPLGAQFAPGGPPGKPSVADIERGSFAEAMGLEKGDRIEAFYINGKPATDLKTLDNLPPNTKIEFLVVRDGKQVPLGTTKRDAPALTLFPALDHEWILWTPHGYYETSTLGDRRYLGWHRNRLKEGEPTDYFAFDHFEKELRRPDALLRFWQTADREALAGEVPPAPGPAPRPAPLAANEPVPVVAESPLPAVEVVAPARPAFDPLVVPGGPLAVRVRAATEEAAAGRGLIRVVRILVDGGKAEEIAVNPPQAEVNRQVALNLNPGRHKVSVTAVNDRDKERTTSFDVIAQEPPGPAPAPEPTLSPPQLVVLAIGTGQFESRNPVVPRIRYAVEDVRDVAEYLGAPLGKQRFRRVDVQMLLGPEATAARIDQAFQKLDERRRKGELGQGDSVFVIIESHFLGLDRKGPGVILATDSGQGAPSARRVPADRIAEILGQLAEYGCKVLLLVDGVHEKRPEAPQSPRALSEWARSLYRKNVITFVASVHGPSQRVGTRAHGAFAQGVLDSLNVQGRTRLIDPNASGDAPFTLFDFQDAVARDVLGLTNRQQHARCYIPETIPSQSPIFDPPSRRPSKPLRAAND
jgi:WD40 repeat protein